MIWRSWTPPLREISNWTELVQESFILQELCYMARILVSYNAKGKDSLTTLS